MLRHSSDTEPGITRKRMGRYWAYFDADGKRITDRDEIDRLNAIGLPPAYEKAWFCADPDGHLQATGVDARGRKQYRYHADFRAKRESAKYEGLLEFGKALPKLRRRVEQGSQAPRPVPRSRARRGRAPARHRAHPHRQRAICAREQELRRNHAAQPAPEAHRPGPDDAFHRQARDRPRGEDHRHQSEAHLQALPGPARPDAVPVHQRRRRAEAGHFRRRQRLYQGGDAAATSPPSISAPGARA